MKIEHIAMYVNDLEGAKEFFTTFLGGSSLSKDVTKWLEKNGVKK